MRGEENGRDVRSKGEVTAVAAAEPGRAGVPPEAVDAAVNADVSLILPCPLMVLGTTPESETGRPLSDLLRRIGYL